MQTPHLNALRAVEAVLRLGSMARAADELGVTPAAVGQQVRVLEDYLQCRLFERRPGGAVPTEAALRVAPALSGAFSSIAGVLADLATVPDPNRIWITTTEGVAEHWVPARLPGFLGRYPGVDFRLEGSSAVRALGPDGFDFAIRAMARAEVETDCVNLFPNWVAPVCTPGFARRYGLGPDTRRLDGVPLCESDATVTDPARMGWPEWCAANDMGWPEKTKTTVVLQTGGALRMARAGLALALGAAFSSRPALEDGSLVMPFGPGRPNLESYWYVLLWQPGRRLSPVQQAFRDWIAEAARADREAFGA